MSIIHKRIIHILHVETNIFTNKIPLDFEMSKTATQITVFNNKKMYNLLSSVVHKRASAVKDKEGTDKRPTYIPNHRRTTMMLESKLYARAKK